MTDIEAPTHPFSREFATCPFPHFQRMRSEAAIHQVDDLPYYLVSRYEECVAILRDLETFSSEHGRCVEALEELGMAPTPEAIEAIRADGLAVPTAMFNELIHRDPPHHTRQRRLVSRWFAPKAVEQAWTGIVQSHVNRLLDGLDGRNQVEFISEFATPLPVRVIAEVLGVPYEREIDFKRWSDATSVMRPKPEDWPPRARAMADMTSFFTAEIEDRLARPRTDLLSHMVLATQDEVDPTSGDAPLTLDEVLDMVRVLLVAGNETTTQLLGEMMLLLLENPDQAAKVAAQRNLLPNAIEEALRMCSPLVSLMRFVTRDTEVAGTRMPKGSVVAVLFASANRDEQVFDRGENLIVDRSNVREHIAFGVGAHYCLGAPLARLEARVAFNEFLDRWPSIRLMPDAPIERAHATLGLRGLSRLEVQIGHVES